MSKNVQAHWLETAALCGVDIEKYDEEVKVIIDSASNCSLTNLFSTDNKE